MRTANAHVYTLALFVDHARAQLMARAAAAVHSRVGHAGIHIHTDIGVRTATKRRAQYPWGRGGRMGQG